MRKKIIPLSVVLALHFSAGNCFARAAAFSVPIDALGFSGDQLLVTDSLRLRAGNAHFSYSGGQAENVFFTREENNLTSSAIADYHPWTDGGFRISAGFFYNDERTTAELHSVGTNNILPYTDEIRQQSVAPYLGLGWGMAPTNKRDWIFTLDVGFVYQGQDAASAAQCRAGSFSPACMGYSDDQSSMEELQYTIERYGLYPVLSAGVTFKF